MNGITAPKLLATLAISSSSVLTKTPLSKFAFLAASIVQAIRGFPPNSARFFPGSLTSIARK